MGSLEELFVRHEETFSSLNEEGIVDWLSNKGKHGAKESFRPLARNLHEPFRIEKDIEDATTLNGVDKASSRIPSLKIKERDTNLKQGAEEKKQEITKKIFSQVGASGNQLNKITSILKDNNYDLSTLRYHSYELITIEQEGKRRVIGTKKLDKLKGEFKEINRTNRIGIWQVGKRGFVANVSEPPRELQEATPSFEIPGEE